MREKYERYREGGKRDERGRAEERKVGEILGEEGK